MHTNRLEITKFMLYIVKCLTIKCDAIISENMIGMQSEQATGDVEELEDGKTNLNTEEKRSVYSKCRPIYNVNFMLI